MKNCYHCKSEFYPKRHYHWLCNNCVDIAKKCGKCNKTVFPKNGIYTHCGVSETVEKVEYVEAHNAAVERRLARAIFGGTFGIMEKHGMDFLEREYLGVYDDN